MRAREPGGRVWWIAAGIAAGLGLLAKYAMVYWLLSAFGFVLLVPGERRHLRPLLGAAGIAVLLYLPNLWWNWSNGFVSYLHVRDNADLSRSLCIRRRFSNSWARNSRWPGRCSSPRCWRSWRARAFWREPRALLLAVFALPSLAMMLGLSWLSRAQPNWAAPAYVSASVLVVGWMLARRLAALGRRLGGRQPARSRSRVRRDRRARFRRHPVPAKYDPLHRLRGWRELGDGSRRCSRRTPD